MRPAAPRAYPSPGPASWQGGAWKAGCRLGAGWVRGRGTGGGVWAAGQGCWGRRVQEERRPWGPGWRWGVGPASPACLPLCRRDRARLAPTHRVETLGGSVRAAEAAVGPQSRPPLPAPSILNDASLGKISTGRLQAGSVVRRPFLKPPSGGPPR